MKKVLNGLIEKIQAAMPMRAAWRENKTGEKVDKMPIFIEGNTPIGQLRCLVNFGTSATLVFPSGARMEHKEPCLVFMSNMPLVAADKYSTSNLLLWTKPDPEKIEASIWSDKPWTGDPIMVAQTCGAKLFVGGQLEPMGEGGFYAYIAPPTQALRFLRKHNIFVPNFYLEAAKELFELLNNSSDIEAANRKWLQNRRGLGFIYSADPVDTWRVADVPQLRQLVAESRREQQIQNAKPLLIAEECSLTPEAALFAKELEELCERHGYLYNAGHILPIQFKNGNTWGGYRKSLRKATFPPRAQSKVTDQEALAWLENKEIAAALDAAPAAQEKTATKSSGRL